MAQSALHRPAQDREIAALFAPVKVCAFTSPVSDALVAELRAEEAAATGPMAAGRRAEFATARACARAALSELGVDTGVPRQQGGAPQWPPGIVGSISHTRGFCAAVAASATERASIGIDVEEVGRVKPAVERRILVDEERAWLDRLDADERRQSVATIFAAKEAFYKAHYVIDARYLGFDAVTVHVHSNRIKFAPASGAVDAALLERASGQALVQHGRVIVGVVIATADGTGPLRSPA